MNSHKQKRQKGFNNNRKEINDGYSTNEDVINRNLINTNQSETRASDDSPSIAPDNTHETQVIKINGKLYAPIQQEYRSQEKKIIKDGYKDGITTSTMNHHHMDNNRTYGHPSYSGTSDNYHHLQDKTSSTPKRINEQLNRSNELSKKVRRDDSNQQHQAFRTSPTVNPASRSRNVRNLMANQQTYSTSATTNANTDKPYSFPLEQLKRAVGCNLPCFMIEFDQSIAPRNIPSAIISCDLIQEHLTKNNIFIKGFSVAFFAGHRLKVGVDNMEDYAKLVCTDNWPTEIIGKKIIVIKPKFVPDCFALVVRYVPKELPLQMVVEEIQRSISSADNFKQIVYSFDRPTKDIRFTVADLAEYEGALKLGRLSIASRLHPITKYLPANKLTFCTNCWEVGHLRGSCKTSIRKCRVCLEVFDRDHMSKCSGNPQCAQCGLDHHSLDPKCELIRNYRQKLNQEVKQAVNNGTINRRNIQLHQSYQAPFFNANHPGEFPAIQGKNNNNNTKEFENKAWSRNNTRSSTNNSMNPNNTITAMIVKLNQDIKNEMGSLKETILRKLDEKSHVNARNIQLHQVSICSINTAITSIIKNVLHPLVNMIPAAKREWKQQISTALNELQIPFLTNADNARMSYSTEFNPRQSIIPIPTASNVNNSNNQPFIPLSTPTANDTPTLIEDTDGMGEGDQL